MRVLVLLLALAACSAEPPSQHPAAEAPAQTASNAEALAQMPSWDQARAAGVDFRAVGQEPGWMLDIYAQGPIRMIWDYGEQSAEFPLGAPSYPVEGATRYEAQAGGHTLAIVIRRFPCEDVMSGEAYPSTVEVTIDGRALNGCGRSM